MMSIVLAIGVRSNTKEFQIIAFLSHPLAPTTLASHVSSNSKIAIAPAYILYES